MATTTTRTIQITITIIGTVSGEFTDDENEDDTDITG